jgi:hypothetical protein
MGYGLDIGFIDTLYTLLGTTGNYSATTNLHTLQFTTDPLSLFPACCVLTSRSLAKASNSGDSSNFHAQALPSLTFIQNCLPAIPSTKMDHHPFSTSLAELKCTQHYQTSAPFFYNHFARTEKKTSLPTIPLLLLRTGCHGNVFTEPLTSNECLLWLHYSGLQASCHNIKPMSITSRPTYSVHHFTITHNTVPTEPTAPCNMPCLHGSNQ